MSNYKQRDIAFLDEVGGYYIKHVMAMTEEKLERKSDIAAELAYRDYLITDLMNQISKLKRGEQMTLGELINRLHEFNMEDEICNLSNPHSYRGYYEHLAFEYNPLSYIKVKYIIEMCEGCIGKVFEGYKGGEYEMNRNTPVWIAKYGYSGEKIIDVTLDSGVISTIDRF